MSACRDMDLIRYIERNDITEEMQAHIQGCGHCQTELMRLKQAIPVLTRYFQHAFETECPQAEQLIDPIINPDMPADPNLHQHITACPSCSRVSKLLEEFKNEIGEPAVSKREPLPENIAKSIRVQRVAERTRHALETLMEKGAKTKELIKDMIAKTLAGPDIQGAPAARDDLTHGRDEVRPEAEPESKPDETGDKDK